MFTNCYFIQHLAWSLHGSESRAGFTLFLQHYDALVPTLYTLCLHVCLCLCVCVFCFFRQVILKWTSLALQGRLNQPLNRPFLYWSPMVVAWVLINSLTCVSWVHLCALDMEKYVYIWMISMHLLTYLCMYLNDSNLQVHISIFLWTIWNLKFMQWTRPHSHTCTCSFE